jgi:hypothetical protein
METKERDVGTSKENLNKSKKRPAVPKRESPLRLWQVFCIVQV